jgi:hypothetical protein
MRRLYLVGESEPADKRRRTKKNPEGVVMSPVDCADLKEKLLALDPRHGVFPNLVMTPLIGTLYACEREQREVVWDSWTAILDDSSDRRFNVFAKRPDGTGHTFVMHSEIQSRWSGFNPDQEAWVLFGFRTSFGLLRWLLTGEHSHSEAEIKGFAHRFLADALTNLMGEITQPRRNHARRLGMLHHFLTRDEPRTCEALGHALTNHCALACDLASTSRKLRSVVPLLHNEAYHSTPIGNVQSQFMCYASNLCDATPSEVYWKFCGRAIVGAMQRQS